MAAYRTPQPAADRGKPGGPGGADRIAERALRRRALLVAAALLLVLCEQPDAGAAARGKPSFRFFRSVYVLRHINPGGHWPAVNVPRAVRTHDTTSALLAHPDRTFVLESVSRDLTEAAKTGLHPEARYYAARAFALRGMHAEAADAMKAHVADAPFRNEDYLFLAGELYACAEYQSSLAVVREWQMRDTARNACSEDRLTYAWGNLQALSRHREAMEEVLSDPCASWKGQLFFAKSSLDLGDEAGAEARVAALMEASPEKRLEISLFWARLSTAERFP